MGGRSLAGFVLQGQRGEATVPKQLELANGAVVERWTIVNYSVTPPTLPGTVDGSLSVNYLHEVLIDGVVKTRQVTGDGASGPAFHRVWDDVAERFTALRTNKVPVRQAYYRATRDALYAYGQRDGGPIPPSAV